MEEYKQITLDEWTQWKEDIRRKLAETTNNFVYIGYRLKQIRDSGMYDGAADVFEFAEKEYGLGKSTVSRFIAINERYSEGGNSLELKEEFRGFSSSKLAEMLTLPDSEIQLITEKTTIREIRELKNFSAQDPEGQEEAAGFAYEQERTPLEKCVIDFFKVRKEILNGVMKHLETDPPEYKQAAEMIAPSGQASHKKGVVFLFLYDWNTGIKYKLMMEPEPVAMSWPEFLNIIYGIFGACDQTDVWEDFYGEPEVSQEVGTEEAENHLHNESNQEVEPVATSQQDECLKNKEEQEAAGVENRENGESKAQGEDGADSAADWEHETGLESRHDEAGAGGGSGSGSDAGGADCEGGAGVAPVRPEDEQIEGQMNIADYPEYMPDNGKNGAQTADMEKPETVITDLDGRRQHIENQKKQMTRTLQRMIQFCDEESWDKLIELSQEIITRAESIKNLMEVWNV